MEFKRTNINHPLLLLFILFWGFSSYFPRQMPGSCVLNFRRRIWTVLFYQLHQRKHDCEFIISWLIFTRLVGKKTYFSTVKNWSENFSAVSDSATPWTIQSLWFFRQEYWRGQPIPSPVDLPNPGIEPRSLPLQADSLPAEPPRKL